MTDLTESGRRWAEAQPAEKRIPAIALHGRETGWPEAFIECAVGIANEHGQAQALGKAQAVREAWQQYPEGTWEAE